MSKGPIKCSRETAWELKCCYLWRVYWKCCWQLGERKERWARSLQPWTKLQLWSVLGVSHSDYKLASPSISFHYMTSTITLRTALKTKWLKKTWKYFSIQHPANIRQRVKVALGVDSQTHSLHLCLFPFLPSFYLFSLRVESLEGLCVHVQSFQSCWLLATLWTIAHQAPQSMGFPRRDYWSGLPCPPQGDLPNPGIKQRLLQLLHCRQNLHRWATREAFQGLLLIFIRSGFH